LKNINQLTQEAARLSEGLEGVEEQAERTSMEVTRLKMHCPDHEKKFRDEFVYDSDWISDY
jgi:hypothetical protein